MGNERERGRGERSVEKSSWKREERRGGGWVGFGFLLCLATMSVNLGPGVLFQHNGREKSSIIRRWPTEEREGQSRDSLKGVQWCNAHISLRRFFENSAVQ